MRAAQVGASPLSGRSSVRPTTPSATVALLFCFAVQCVGAAAVPAAPAEGQPRSEEDGKGRTAPPPLGRFVLTPGKPCAPGHHLDLLEDCEAAAEELGLGLLVEEVNPTALPTGCAQRPRPEADTLASPSAEKKEDGAHRPCEWRLAPLP